jgi:hypothetical protein
LKYSGLGIRMISKCFKNDLFRLMLEGCKCCLEDVEENPDSRTNLFKPGENDGE